MTIFEQIKSLAKSRNITMKDLALKLGFSENLFYTWKKTNPKASDLEKVADYFGVTVDFLLGREEKASIKEAIDLTEIANADDDSTLWDKILRSGGRPLTAKDKAAIRLQFSDMWEDILKKNDEIDRKK